MSIEAISKKVQLQTYVRMHKKQSILSCIFVFMSIGYSLVFLLPKQAQFSYAGPTCVRQLTLFPALHKSTSDKYSVTFSKEQKVGSLALSSLETCFSVNNEPKEGSETVGTAPFGGIIFKKQFSVRTDKAPVALTSSISIKPIPVTKKLVIPMTKTDKLYDYELRVASKNTPCEAIEKAISCDVPALKLEQGVEARYNLQKQFRRLKAQTVMDGELSTLKAVAVSNGSVQAGQTVYARPKLFTFEADKPLKSIQATLTQDGKAVKVASNIEGRKVTVAFEENLDREKNYVLTISKLEADDGSTLIEPYKVPFLVSGGPKVTNVSVGQSGVAQSAGIILSFDQSVSKTQDLTKWITFGGGAATIQKINDTQVRVQLNALPLCQAFSISIKNGFESEYTIPTKTPWSFASRTVCYTTISYGTSLNGRPLIAYIFGGGGATTMFVGAIHGNESSSSGIMKAWVNELEANPNRLAGKRIVVIPTINPDGVAANTRTNSRGVNLNRNFPTANWTKSIDDTDGKHETGGGEAPLSEPESSALARITQQYRPQLLLSYHAVGSLVAGDPGGYSAGFAAKYASAVSYRDATNSTATTFDYDITGSYEDWTYRNIGIPSMVIELGSYSYYSFSYHRDAMWAMVQ